MRKIEAFLFIVVLGVAGYFGYNYYKNNLAKQTSTPTTQTDSSSTVSKTLTNISIRGNVKTDYKPNEDIDFLSAQLQLNYSDNSEECISLSNSMVKDFDSSTCGDKSYEITYLDKTLTVKYSVNSISFGKGYILTDNYKFKSGNLVSTEANVLTECYEFDKNGVGVVYQIQNNDFVALDDFTWKYDSTIKLTITKDSDTSSFLIDSDGYVQLSTSVSGNTEYDTLTQKFTYYKYPLRSVYFVNPSSLVFYLNDSIDTIDYSKYKVEVVDGNNVSRQIPLTKDMVSGLDFTTTGTKTLKITYFDVTNNVSYIVNPVRYGKYKLRSEYWLDSALQTASEWNPNTQAYFVINEDKTFEYFDLTSTTPTIASQKGTWKINNGKFEMTADSTSSSTLSFDIDGNGKLSSTTVETTTQTVTSNGTTYSYNKRINYLVFIG
jgi:hypothetical protein